MRSFIWILSVIFCTGIFFGFHYSPKEINDDFSENVYLDYLDNLDGQHRFFLQTDINSFRQYKHKIDDQIKNTELTFFDLTYSKIIERMDQVEQFYKELLEQPFDFSKKHEIDLDFETAPYASDLFELKKLWRTRFKLSALQNFTSTKEDELKQFERDSTFTLLTDIELERKARENIK